MDFGLVQGNQLSIVFSDVCLDVGLTIYEAAGGGALPKNGEEWHTIRRGMLKELPHCSQDFNALIKVRYMEGKA
jgi:hypothetical protein